jgi:hypothetical protein
MGVWIVGLFYFGKLLRISELQLSFQVLPFEEQLSPRASHSFPGFARSNFGHIEVVSATDGFLMNTVQIGCYAGNWIGLLFESD